MSKYYNLDQLDDMSGGDQEFMQTVVATFLEEIPADLAAMTMAIENDNHKMAYQFAHKMKPNLEMFGIDLEKEITQMESWSETDKPPSEIQPQLNKITEMISLAIAAMKTDWNM